MCSVRYEPIVTLCMFYYYYYYYYYYIMVTAIELSLGGSSPYTSTDRTYNSIYT
jgi:hypothetical protein